MTSRNAALQVFAEAVFDEESGEVPDGEVLVDAGTAAFVVAFDNGGLVDVAPA